MDIAITDARPRPGPAPVERLANETAFEEVFALHAPALLRYVAARIGRDAAADVVAEAFARAYRDRARFDPARGTLRGWLHGIVANGLRDHRRSERRHLAALSRLEAEWTPDHAAAEPAGAVFLHALTRLRRDDRELILLLAWGELSYEEIAQAPGLPLPGPAPASAAERLTRALALADVVVHHRMVGDVVGAAPASTDGAAVPTPAASSSTYERWETVDGSLTLADEGSGWVVERSRAGDRVAVYSPSRNVIVSALGADVGTPQDGIPSLAEIVVGLRSGRVAAREAVLAGRAVLEVGTGDGLGVTVFDARTYRPLEVRYGPQSVYRYVDYSVVPRTGASVEAVSLAARHPDARLVDDAALYSVVLGELYPNG